MINDKRVIEFLRTNYREIMSTYTIFYSSKSQNLFAAGMICKLPISPLIDIKNYVKSFSNSCDLYPLLIKYCKEKNIEETELYKKAHVSKTVFSKIRSMKDTSYKPGKSTVICLCLALELTPTETTDILNIVGYSLSNAIIADKIISYCISKQYYDVYEIENLILEQTGGPYLYS